MSNSSDESYSDEEDEEELDPRIQDELEKLNAATNSINHLEAELDESRAIFRQTLAGATYQLNALAHKLGKCVEKSRPFYESYRQLKQAHYMLQKSTNQFERASGMHFAARRRVTEAEERAFGGGGKRAFDSALQEMLNQATIEVNEAEKMKRESWKKHQEDLRAYRDLEAKVKQLLKKLKSPVEKAKPYFELKSEFDRHLWQLKLRVDSIYKGLGGSKENYSGCLKSLEIISDDIHEKRKTKRMDAMLAKLHERGAGVGADSSNEDEVSLSPSTLDLDFDSSLKFDNIERLAAGKPDEKNGDDWRSIQPTVVVIESDLDPGRIHTPFARTVAGCEGSGAAAPPLSDREAVYGHESGSEEDTKKTLILKKEEDVAEILRDVVESQSEGRRLKNDVALVSEDQEKQLTYVVSESNKDDTKASDVADGPTTESSIVSDTRPLQQEDGDREDRLDVQEQPEEEGSGETNLEEIAVKNSTEEECSGETILEEITVKNDTEEECSGETNLEEITAKNGTTEEGSSETNLEQLQPSTDDTREEELKATPDNQECTSSGDQEYSSEEKAELNENRTVESDKYENQQAKEEAIHVVNTADEGDVHRSLNKELEVIDESFDTEKNELVEKTANEIDGDETLNENVANKVATRHVEIEEEDHDANKCEGDETKDDEILADDISTEKSESTETHRE